MKTLCAAALFLFSMSNSSRLSAQGIIHGLVTDSLTMDQLKGAEITLTGTSFSAVSNTDGEFRITGIPPGEYMLQTSYLGYKEKEYLVDVSEEPLELRVELLPVTAAEDGALFTQQARGQAEEINQQIRSNIIKNVISSDNLQDLPDESIPVALSRLPGISIVNRPYEYPWYRSTGGFAGSKFYFNPVVMPPTDEFSFADDPYPRVMIRGLDSKLSSITLNGTRISPTSANDKSVDLSIFPQREFQSIELHKTITSEEDGDATAGVIDIATGSAPYKRTIRAELSGNDNGFEKSANQCDFTGRYGDRFADDLLGVQVDANFGRKILSGEYRSRNFVGGLGTLEPFNILAYGNTERERIGADILLDFVTPDGGSVKLNSFYNRTTTDYFESKADSSASNLGLPLLTYCDREVEQRVFLSSAGGRNHLFGFDVDWNVAFSDSRTGNPYYYRLDFYFNEFNPREPWYYLDNSIDSPSKSYCREQTASVDITKKYILVNEVKGELTVGGKYRINSRSFDENLRGENCNLSGDYQYTRLADGSLVLRDFSGTRFDGLVGKSKDSISLSYFQDNPSSNRILFGEYKIPLINEDALRLWRQLNYSDYYLVEDVVGDQTYYNYNAGPDINSYYFSRGVFAGYIMHDLDFGQWAQFITGIRIESEHNSYSGYYFPNALTTADNLYNGIPQKTRTDDYDKVTVFPNFQMLLQPVDFLNMRMAVYETLIRPDCSTRTPKIFGMAGNVVTYNGVSAGNYLNMGNPDLKNSDVWNYEFQIQFYGNDIGQLSIDAFYKDIKGMVQATNGIELSRASTVDSLGINWNSFPVGFPFKDINSYYYLYTYFNSPKPTRIWGFEIEHQADFRYLPGLLRNIVLNYNLTVLRSETWILDITHIATTSTEDLISYKKYSLSNMPEFLANVNLGYDIKGFSFRISYFYQGAYPISDDYYSYQIKQNKLSRLDVAVKQRISKNISVILNANNITNSSEEASYRHLFAANWQNAQAYRVGMNLSFGVRVDL